MASWAVVQQPCACAQVTLYQLLMEERYGATVERGLLWYVAQASPEVVRMSPYEVCLLP